MSRNSQSNNSPLASKIAAANVLPTTYFAPTPDQAEALLIALMADADWSNEIVRYSYNAEVEDLVLTVTGIASPAGFNLNDLPAHDIATLQKAAAKRKEAAKADRSAARPLPAWASKPALPHKKGLLPWDGSPFFFAFCRDRGLTPPFLAE